MTVAEFCRQFPEEDFSLSEDAASEAVRRRSQFNIIQPRSGLKVDVEDAIVKKMEFFRDGGSDKHLRDITGVLKTSAGEIDRDYIDRWATTLGLTDIWQAILDRMRE